MLTRSLKNRAFLMLFPTLFSARFSCFHVLNIYIGYSVLLEIGVACIESNIHNLLMQPGKVTSSSSMGVV